MTRNSFKLIAILLFLTLTAVSPAKAQRVFFADRDPVVIRQTHGVNPVDYMQLFNQESPWAAAAEKLNVFSVVAQFVLYGTDDQLRTVFNDMKRRHIQMAVEMGTVVRLDSCGMGEGYAPPGMAEHIAKRLHDLGLEIDYIMGDEPVSFTHSKTQGDAEGRPNCVYPLSVVADRTMMTINAVRKYFPAIQFGDIEVAALDPHLAASQRLIDYVEFARLMQTHMGHKLSFFHADVAWRTDPLSTLAPMRAAFKAEGIPFGVILGGSPKDTTDEGWEQDALSRLDLLERNPATRLDDIIVHSWQPLPSLVLPETAAGTSTNLLLRAERLAAKYQN